MARNQKGTWQLHLLQMLSEKLGIKRPSFPGICGFPEIFGQLALPTADVSSDPPTRLPVTFLFQVFQSTNSGSIADIEEFLALCC